MIQGFNKKYITLLNPFQCLSNNKCFKFCLHLLHVLQRVFFSEIIPVYISVSYTQISTLNKPFLLIRWNAARNQRDVRSCSAVFSLSSDPFGDYQVSPNEFEQFKYVCLYWPCPALRRRNLKTQSRRLLKEVLIVGLRSDDAIKQITRC